MSEHDPRSFNNLPCPRCDSTLFIALVRLKHKPGGGLVPDAGGYACAKCHAVTDAAQALQAYSLKLKQDLIRRLQDELEEDRPVAVVPGDKES